MLYQRAQGARKMFPLSTLSGSLTHVMRLSVTFLSTYIHGHSLDLMTCFSGCIVLSVSISDLISDHFSVVADLLIPSNHSRTVPQTIKYRKLQSINIAVEH